ncbi:MAG: TetR/AcrR family transcriptional regulator, partial [Actinomycetes bacterium]|nr:TetR/AcrR family transcriptional regulator [Actinomycetes bacterium]
QMSARAASTAATREAVLGALIQMAGARPIAAITLDDVAALAGVSVQTVLRHFGSRDGLLDAAVEHARPGVMAERTPAGPRPADAVRALTDHYERMGDLVLRLLTQEDDERVRRITEPGKRDHRAWVSEAFDAALPRDPAHREAVVDMLVVATDVYAWKLLRRDRGLSRTATEARILGLVRAVLTT